MVGANVCLWSTFSDPAETGYGVTRSVSGYPSYCHGPKIRLILNYKQNCSSSVTDATRFPRRLPILSRRASAGKKKRMLFLGVLLTGPVRMACGTLPLPCKICSMSVYICTIRGPVAQNFWPVDACRRHFLRGLAGLECVVLHTHARAWH